MESKWELYKEKLYELIQRFEDIRLEYREFTRKGDLSKESLIEYEGRFVDLKADTSPLLSYFSRQFSRFDDKSATAIKYRIANSIYNGEHPDYEQCSINQSEKFAASSSEYKEFIDKRSIFKELFFNIKEIKEDMNSYINEIKDRLKLIG